MVEDVGGFFVSLMVCGEDVACVVEVVAGGAGCYWVGVTEEEG